MASQQALKQTPVHAAHVKAGAKMVPFAGFEMPVRYTGVIDEHRAVRQKAGLFDVSHMGEIVVRGSDALALVQNVTCNDASRLTPGRVQYSGLMSPRGGFVDDVLVYRRADDDFFLVVNAANREKDLSHLREHAAKYRSAEVVDESEVWGQLAVQGPEAESIVGQLTGHPLERIAYYRFATVEVGGAEAILSRTGYTGEDGFEIYAPAERTEALWYEVLGAGGAHGLVPVGLGARDTLRLEARMALYGNDIDESTTPYEAGLGWIVKLKKGEFLGRDELERQKREGVSRKLVGFEMDGRVPARSGYSALRDGERVGKVTSGGPSPTLGRNIGLAYLPDGMWEPDTRFEVEVRGHREGARVVPTPFYRRDQ